MKKSSFLLALGAMALTACTSTDVIEEGVQSNAIGFQNVISRPSRAVDDGHIDGDLTGANLDKIFVYGYYTNPDQGAKPILVFGGTEVSKAADGSSWSYDNIRYWVPDARYYFYAYSCADIQLNHTYGTPTLDLINDDDRVLKFTGFICDSRHQHDLIYAFNEGRVGQKPQAGASVNSVVDFKFKHILTKINAMFDSDFDPNYNVKISNVKIRNFRNVGNYSPKNGWTNVVRSNEMAGGETTPVPEMELKMGSSNIASKGTKTAVSQNVYVLPYNYVNGDVVLQFNIEVTDKRTGEIALSRTLTGTWSPNWVTGYSYTYRIKITGTSANLEEIRFGNMNVDGWTGDNSSSTDVEITFSAN